MNTLIPGSVAWYVTGRFYQSADGTLQDLGYFINLADIEGELFNGEMNEANAYFTFRSEPFQSSRISNGNINLSIAARGDFCLYFNKEPRANFNDPDSFSQGEEIALLRRRNVVMGLTLGINVATALSEIFTTNLFTADLVSTRAFEFNGKQYDLKQLIPHGITQWGFAATESLGALHQFTAVIPFAASAIAIGK